MLIVVALIAIPIVAVLSYSVYRAFDDSRMESYLQDVDQIQAEANALLDDYNTLLAYFQPEPAISAQVLPAFKEIKPILDTTIIRLEAIEPPEAAAVYHESLIELYRESSALAADLSPLSDFINARIQLITGLSDSLALYQSSLSAATTGEEIIAAAESFRSSTALILERLRSLEVPLPVYSSSQLEQNLDALSQNLAALQEAVRVKDIDALETAASNISQLFSKDWTVAMAELDAEAVSSYQEQVNKIVELQQHVIEQRAALGSSKEKSSAGRLDDRAL